MKWGLLSHFHYHNRQCPRQLLSLTHHPCYNIRSILHKYPSLYTTTPLRNDCSDFNQNLSSLVNFFHIRFSMKKYYIPQVFRQHIFKSNPMTMKPDVQGSFEKFSVLTRIPYKIRCLIISSDFRK